jgi:hypothetical protein
LESSARGVCCNDLLGRKPPESTPSDPRSRSFALLFSLPWWRSAFRHPGSAPHPLPRIRPSSEKRRATFAFPSVPTTPFQLSACSSAPTPHYPLRRGPSLPSALSVTSTTPTLTEAQVTTRVRHSLSTLMANAVRSTAIRAASRITLRKRRSFAHSFPFSVKGTGSNRIISSS